MTSNEKVYVIFNARKGLDGERVITERDWKSIGIDFHTVRFNTQNAFLQDATGWPLPVLHYFEQVDVRFTVKREAVAPGETDPSERSEANGAQPEENTGSETEPPTAPVE